MRGAREAHTVNLGKRALRLVDGFLHASGVLRFLHGRLVPGNVSLQCLPFAS